MSNLFTKTFPHLKKPPFILDESMPIYSPTGFLDITNATLRTSNTECQNLQIGSGNVYVTTDLTSNLVLNLENITNLGNSTSNTMHFTNATTGLVVDSNIVITGNVTAGSFFGDGSGLTSIPPSAITGTLSQWSDGTNSDVYIASNVGIGNVHTLTSNTLQVGANLYVRDADANVLTVTGNVAADYFEGDGSKLTGISSTLQAITDSGNVTSNTVQFTNATTGFVTTSNIEVGGALKINTITAAAYHSLQAVTNVGNVTSNTVQFSNATTGFVTTGNVEVGRDLSVTGNLTVLGTRTIVDTDTLRVKDPIIELGKDNPGTGDLGLVMTRPSGSSNVGIIFDESEGTLEIGYTQSNASDTDITMRTAATEPIDVNVNGNVSVGKELTVTGNVAVDTDTLFVDSVNDRVGVGTTTPGSALDVVGDVNIVSNVNMLHTANTASIKLNSNVVTEFPRSKKLIKYPRINLTSASRNAYENGYKVTYSSEYNTTTWTADHVFNSDLTDGAGSWASAGNKYTSSGQTYSGGASIGGFSGEYVHLELPVSIHLSLVRMLPRTYALPCPQAPKNYSIIASTDGVTYDLLERVIDEPDSGIFKEIHINTSKSYNRFAIVVEKTISADVVGITEIEYYGIPEYDPDAVGTDVVVKSVPNVPNTDWLEVYYDGQDYTTMPATVTDNSGNNRTGTPSGGVGFDTENKAFTFDGVDDYVTSTTLSSHFAGDPTVTYACWVKFNAMTTGQMFLTINAPGVYGQGVIGGLFLGTDGTIYNTVGNRGIQASEKLVTNRWYHLVATKIPGNTGTDTQKLYIDGVYVSQFPWNTSGNQVIGSNPVLRIGAAGNGNDRLNGYMANVRLFNRALTSDEVWQLYAYQKEYFGHGDLGMTLKAGRLGIGTSEPRAALDVRGGFQCGNSPLQFFVVNGQFPATGTTQTVTNLPQGLKDRIRHIVLIQGLTVEANGDITNWIRHGSTTWEVDISVDVSVPHIYLSGFDATNVNITSKAWRIFVVTT